jgi:hypothetical protein
LRSCLKVLLRECMFTAYPPNILDTELPIGFPFSASTFGLTFKSASS